MSYEPKKIPVADLRESLRNMSEDAKFEASKKIANPLKKRRAQYSADFWFTLHSIIEDINKKEVSDETNH